MILLLVRERFLHVGGVLGIVLIEGIWPSALVNRNKDIHLFLESTVSSAWMRIITN